MVSYVRPSTLYSNALYLSFIVSLIHFFTSRFLSQSIRFPLSFLYRSFSSYLHFPYDNLYPQNYLRITHFLSLSHSLILYSS